MIVCFNFFEKIALDLASYLLNSSLFSMIENFMGAPTSALQNFFAFYNQRCNDQRF